MSVLFIGFLTCLIIFLTVVIVSNVNHKQQVRRLTMQVTPLNRGERSERRVVLELLKIGIDPRAIFHDLYIQKPNGEYTQVDVAVATKAGIIVFEVKDYRGWIFGNEHQKYWTQILAYGREKNRFYNPILQNAGHIQAIRQCLPQNPGIPFYSVIVFWGDNELKNVICNVKDTFVIYPHSIRQVVAEILMRPNANYGNKHEIMDIFTKAVQAGNNPMIVSSQINTAAYYGRNKPQSIHKRSFRPIYFRSYSHFVRFKRRERSW